MEIGGERLLDIKLACPNMGENADSADKSEYIGLAEWLKTVPRKEAKWKSGAGIYTHSYPRLARQPTTTVEFLSEEFGIDLRSLVV